MDLAYLLNHDVCNIIIKYIDLTCIINLASCSKSMPDLLQHRSTNKLFLQEMNDSMPKNLLDNKKIIAYIYNHQLVKYTSKNAYNVVDHWSYEIAVPRMISAIIDKNDSYLFFCIYSNNIVHVKIEIVIESLTKYDMFDMFWINVFGKKYNECNVSECMLRYMWITIPLIMNDKYCIERILAFCDTSPYTLHLTPFDPEKIVREYSGSCEMSINEYIKKYHPEFIPILTSIKTKAIKYNNDTGIMMFDPQHSMMD